MKKDFEYQQKEYQKKMRENLEIEKISAQDQDQDEYEIEEQDQNSKDQ